MEELAERFEAERGQLRAVAYRMLGSLAEAEDAVQETWLRLSRVDPGGIENLAAWLRTVIARICLDGLRARRHEEPVEEHTSGLATDDDPEREAVLVESVGRALLVVLDRMPPAERVAFVLHDSFAVPFEQIAPIVGRTPVAAKKLASRARQRVHGEPVADRAELGRHRLVVDAFLHAARGGDVTTLLTLLAPDVVRVGDPTVLPAGVPVELRGAQAAAEEITLLGRQSRFAEPALVNGRVGVVVAPRGRLVLALAITVADGQIAGYQVIADPDRLRRLDLAVL